MKSITLIVFGGTGDLARKKLLPAIKRISEKNPDQKINFVAIGRRDFTVKDYIEFSKINEVNLPIHVTINYFKADFEVADSLSTLPNFLKNIEENCIGRVFYFATSASFFGKIAKQLALHFTEQNIFNNIMLEKPFGHDLASSKELESELIKYFPEEQIYRVDHYLAKDTVQNILVLRLSNPFIEKTWNGDFIEKIVLTVNEDIGVGDRLGYYDDVGAIRDMIQNHLMQMAALILMDDPISTDAKDIHDAKVRAIRRLEFRNEIIIGQYAGYDEELLNANKDKSNTETFVELKLHSMSEKWNKTQIILKTGKNLDSRHAKIELYYKKEPCNLYCDINTYPNRLILNVQPLQDIEFMMNTKIPKRDFEIKHVKLHFSHSTEFAPNNTESYEIILEECIKCDKTLFISNFEIEASWTIIDKVCEYIKDKKPIIYAKKSKGPVSNDPSNTFL